MKLIRLVAKNFKKLSDFAADFADGLNVLVGENAQGKSTTLQAIEAALFGVTVVPGKKENIPTWGQITFSLELYFEHGGVEYHLTRTKTTAKLVHVEGGEHGDTLLANGNTPVTKYIEELLGLTAKDFNLFVQSKQGETAGVLTFGATALSQKVEEFAGISVIDEVTRKAQERATTGKALAAQSVVDPADMAGAEFALQEAAGQAQAGAEALDAAKARLIDAEAEPQPVPPSVSSAEMHRQRRAADQARAAYDKAEAEERAAADALVVAETDLASAEQPAEVRELEQQVKQTKLEIANIKGRLAEKREKRQALALKAAASAQAEREFLMCEPVSELVVKHAEDLLACVRSDAEKASASLAEMTGQRKRLESLAKDALCPTCGTQLSEHDPEKLKAEIADLKRQEDLVLDVISAGKQEISRLTKHLVTLTKDRDTYLRLKAAADSAEPVDPAALGILDHDIADMEDSGSLFQGALATLTAQIDAAEAVAARSATLQRRVAQAEKRLAEATQERQEAESKLVDGPPDELIELTVAAEAEFEEARHAWQSRHAEAKAAVVAAEHACDLAEILVNSARHRLTTLQQRHADAQLRAAEADRASRLARFLRDRRQSYLKEVWDSVLAVASKHVNMATKGMITGIAYTDGEFSFEEAGIFAPIASASGAQKAFIGTAVRIGLARVLYGSNSLLIFDEPTESMSESRAAGLSASLVGAAHQTILITHREQDQSLAANIITVGA